MTAPALRTADSEALRIFLRLIRPRPLEDPYPLYARLRELAPLLPVRFPGVPSGYLVSTFAGCSRLLRDPAFGPPSPEQLDLLRPGWRANPFTDYLYRSMVFLAGSAHRERRQATSRHFVPARAAQHREQFEQVADLLIARLGGPGVPGPHIPGPRLPVGPGPGHAGPGHAGPGSAGPGQALPGLPGSGPVLSAAHVPRPRIPGPPVPGQRFSQECVPRLNGPDEPPPVDLVQHLALPFAALSLGRLLGIEDDEAIELGGLARQVGAVFEQFASAGQHAAVAEAGPELVRRLAAIAARPGSGGLLAELGAIHGPGEEAERAGAAVLLFGAGFDSPVSMVGLGTKLLLEHPAQARLVAQEPSAAPGAVAEILRYEPPVQLVARTALAPAELAGVPIPAGSMVFGLVGAANRDPAQVKDPEVFDVTRARTPSLSFGAGPHYCLGAYLAALQGEVLFPRLLRAFPGLRLAGPSDPPVFRAPGSTLRGLDRLPVQLGPSS